MKIRSTLLIIRYSRRFDLIIGCILLLFSVATTLPCQDFSSHDNPAAAIFMETLNLRRGSG